MMYIPYSILQKHEVKNYSVNECNKIRTANKGQVCTRLLMSTA